MKKVETITVQLDQFDPVVVAEFDELLERYQNGDMKAFGEAAKKLREMGVNKNNRLIAHGVLGAINLKTAGKRMTEKERFVTRIHAFIG